MYPSLYEFCESRFYNSRSHYALVAQRLFMDRNQLGLPTLECKYQAKWHCCCFTRDIYHAHDQGFQMGTLNLCGSNGQ